MSTQTPPDAPQRLGYPKGVRFRGRDHAPDPLLGPPDVNYPEDDGRPMADNTLQYDWIARIKGGLDVVFADDPNVFVAGNHLWYPVQGNNRRRLAPDAMVIFGRPKGYRSSYVQHLEGGIPPQVVFEVHSPGNRRRVMEYKRNFYQRYGVEEYYYFDPYKIRLDGWLRDGEILRPILETSGWVSPRLGIRFELAEDLTIFAPDGRPFVDFAEIARQRDESEQAARVATDQAEAERQRAEAERQRADRLAARLRALGLDPEE
jgi:Uma2 family endonuclease